MESITLVAAIIAVVKAVKEEVPQIKGIITIILAVVLGAVAGYLNLEGLTVSQGVILGLSAVGAVSVADRVTAK